MQCNYKTVAVVAVFQQIYPLNPTPVSLLTAIFSNPQTVKYQVPGKQQSWHNAATMMATTMTMMIISSNITIVGIIVNIAYWWWWMMKQDNNGGAGDE